MTTRKPKTEINHKNNDPTDNTLDNLELTEAPADPESLQRASDMLAGRSPPSDTTLEMSPEEIGLYNRVFGVSDLAKPEDGVAMTIRHADETIGVWDRITPYRFRFDPAGQAMPVAPAPNSIGQRPYVLESALVEQTLRRQRDAAQSEIEAVEADMLAIETQANNEIADIQARTDTELAARRARKDDLRKIVDMTGRALELDPPPVTNDDVQDALSAAPGFPNTEKD